MTVKWREENRAHEVVPINLLSSLAPSSKLSRFVGNDNDAWRSLNMQIAYADQFLFPLVLSFLCLLSSAASIFSSSFTTFFFEFFLKSPMHFLCYSSLMFFLLVGATMTEILRFILRIHSLTCDQRCMN